MKKIIVDSSVIVKWLHQEDEKYLDQTDKIIKDVEDGNVILLAPISKI